MKDQEELSRAAAVVTALLSGDLGLANDLVESDDDPWGLARGATSLAAGMWDHFATQMGKDPQEAWANGLLQQQIKE